MNTDYPCPSCGTTMLVSRDPVTGRWHCALCSQDFQTTTRRYPTRTTVFKMPTMTATDKNTRIV